MASATIRRPKPQRAGSREYGGQAAGNSEVRFFEPTGASIIRERLHGSAWFQTKCRTSFKNCSILVLSHHLADFNNNEPAIVTLWTIPVPSAAALVVNHVHVGRSHRKSGGGHLALGKSRGAFASMNWNIWEDRPWGGIMLLTLCNQKVTKWTKPNSH